MVDGWDETAEFYGLGQSSHYFVVGLLSGVDSPFVGTFSTGVSGCSCFAPLIPHGAGTNQSLQALIDPTRPPMVL